MENLYRVKRRDLIRCADVLAKAFFEYPMYKHVLGSDHSAETMGIATRFFVNYAYLYGAVYAPSPDIEGVLCTIDYQNYRMNPFRLLRCNGLALVRLGLNVNRKYDEYDKLNSKVHRDVISVPHQYIMCIGVDPEKQGQGLASYMLRPAVQSAAANGYASYLETHNQTNVDIYKRYGFQLMGEHELPNSDITLYAMLKR